MIINGKKIAEDILNQLRKQPTPQKALTAVLVGDDPASISFIRQKQKAAERLGVRFEVSRFPAAITAETLAAEAARLGDDTRVGGIIVQLPLPRHIDRDRVLAALPASKDVDALRGPHHGIAPPAVGTLRVILDALKFKLRGVRAVVLGPGFLVGQPIADYLKGKVDTLQVFGRGADPETLKEALRKADVVISGVGVPGLIRGKVIKKGAVAIDFGYARGLKGLSGDFDFASVAPRASAITPTPGGTGPILVAELFSNFYTLTKATSH